MLKTCAANQLDGSMKIENDNNERALFDIWSEDTGSIS